MPVASALCPAGGAPRCTKAAECTSASRNKDLPKGPSIAAAAASVGDVGGSAVTTAAGVIVVAALANTGTFAWRRLQLNTPARAPRGCTAIGPTLIRFLDVCMCTLMRAVSVYRAEDLDILSWSEAYCS